ncbi:hypothetical protein B9Z55_018512 [Caenorhabditis nigoni]|uniref:Uncharacterized protein n=1 Tax=Caenorhabditis nigoni TaxID=1611254 RepID=A0A2G5TEH7_9PELO|nr:hypothetical protein B9Z55_018512 [Caenorhabditis nigoni]
MTTSVASSSTTKVTYAVGDFVYFDDPLATDAPFQIRKIDELVKTEKGSVDARCVIYMRRRDIPQHLLKIADQAQRRFDNYYEVDKKKPENFTTKGFLVANGAPTTATNADAPGDAKEEEPEDDGPPKIDQEEGVAPARINAGRTGSSVDSEDASLKEKAETEATKLVDWGDGGLPLGVDKLSKEQRLRLRQHEIFMTRQSEILPATLIRGKCRVVLLGDCEEAENYIGQDDTFFHSLVYDPNAQTLLADKGAIRVGEKYQAVVDDWMEPEEREAKEQAEKEAKELAKRVKKEEEAERLRQEKEDDNIENGLKIDEGEDEEMPEAKSDAVVKEETPEEEDATPESREILVWTPYQNLTDRDIDQYLIVARSVGLFARAIDGASAPKLPTLQLAAAFASRDVTILHAYAILHQAHYDVGQAVKYLVPIASKESYPLEVDQTTGLQTKILGGPILCRDQLEEWSTPEMNLFEDALDKCGKDFNEIRADYLPWKSIRDIVEYYYLMKASNRYTDRKKAKPNGGTADEKFTNIYIPPFNKPIAASVQPYNQTQNLVRSEIPCENCGTLDGINWYQWGGVEKKVLCSTCWIKWKKFAGLDQKHDLERFDKTRPPVLDQPTALGTNGSDRPPVLQQQKPTTGAVPARPTVQTPRSGNNPLGTDKQSLLKVAKEALARGQITQEQFIQLNKNFAMSVVAAQQQQQQQMEQLQRAQALAQQAAAGNAAVQKIQKKVTPATKPTVFFYTNICRRAVRRILPKSAFNVRKLTRNLKTSVDEEKILRAMIMMDKRTLLNSAYNAAGDKRNLIVEAEFHKGITHLQHTLTSAATGKRSATQSAVGEPSAKMAKQTDSAAPSGHFLSQQTSRSQEHPFAKPRLPTRGAPMVTPSLEDIGNTLLAVKNTGIFNDRHLTSTSSSCTGQPSYRERIKKLRKTRTDSRWFEINEEVVKLRCGPQLK